MNPLNRSIPQQAGSFGAPNMQIFGIISQIGQMYKAGKGLNEIFTTLKRRGVTPDLVEQALCFISPEVAQFKQEMRGKNVEEFITDKAKSMGMQPEQALQQYKQIIGQFNF